MKQCLDSKALYFIKQRDKIFLELGLAHTSDQSFHVIKITFQSAPPGGRQAVLGFRSAAFERFRAIDVTCLFQFPRMDAQISISGFDRVLQLIESERFVCGQGTDNAQPQALVNHPIDLVRAVWGAAVMYALQLLLLVLIFRYFAPQRCLFSHRTSSQ